MSLVRDEQEGDEQVIGMNKLQIRVREEQVITQLLGNT
jgi:hypothetical protein